MTLHADAEVIDVHFEGFGADLSGESSHESADDDSDPSLPKQAQQTWRARLVEAAPSRSFHGSHVGPDVTGSLLHE